MTKFPRLVGFMSLTIHIRGLFEKIRKTNPYIFLLLLCAFLYLPSSLARDPLAPDEIRNIYIAQNMEEFNDFLFPKYYDETYYEKPPLYFWILKVLILPGRNYTLFLTTLFNVFVAWGILSLNYTLLKKRASALTAMVSCIVLATTAIFLGMSVLIRMDLLFVFFIYLSLFFFIRAIEEEDTYCLLFSGIFSFLAVFTKGALGIIFPIVIESAMAVVLLLRQRRGIFEDRGITPQQVISFSALANALAIVLVFAWITFFASKDPLYFSKMFFEQTYSRGLNPSNHTQPFFYYIPVFFLLFLPWSLVGSGYFLIKNKNSRPLWETFFLVWFIGGLVVLSLIRSKLPMYLLSLTIPFSGLTAKFILSEKKKTRRALFIISVFFFFFTWAAGFVYAVTQKIGIPLFAYFTIPLFVAMAWAVIVFPKEQVRVFCIFWIIFIQALNIFCLSVVSNSSKYKRIVNIINESTLPFDSIIVTEKKLMFLNAYPLKKPIEYVSSIEKVCRSNSFMLITRHDQFPCELEKIIKIKKFSLMYKNHD
ncbi:MAG: glycosyltransferase family 39 protein [Candidatus Omnitrophota bacterium]